MRGRTVVEGKVGRAGRRRTQGVDFDSRYVDDAVGDEEGHEAVDGEPRYRVEELEVRRLRVQPREPVVPARKGESEGGGFWGGEGREGE